jgi:hypothetical protein
LGPFPAVAAELKKGPSNALQEAEATYSDIVWRQQLPLVAQLLKWEELGKVALSYLFWPGQIKTIRDATLRTENTVQDIRANQSQHQTLQLNLSGVATAFSEASALLAKKVLVREELRKFEQEWAVSKSGIQKTLERPDPSGP